MRSSGHDSCVTPHDLSLELAQALLALKIKAVFNRSLLGSAPRSPCQSRDCGTVAYCAGDTSRENLKQRLQRTACRLSRPPPYILLLQRERVSGGGQGRCGRGGLPLLVTYATQLVTNALQEPLYAETLCKTSERAADNA